MTKQADSIVLSVRPSEELRKYAADFLQEAENLWRVHPGQFDVGFRIEFGPPALTTVTISATETERKAAVHALRPFALNDEPFFVPKFLNAFKRENSDELLTRAADTLRDLFFIRSLPFIVESHLGQVDREKLWQDYANAFEYHRDPRKREMLEAQFIASPESLYFLFWLGVSVKCNAVLSMMGFAAMLCGKAQGFTFNNLRA